MKRKKRGKYSLLKHMDFVGWDFATIELSFFIACMVRYETFISLIEKYVYMSIVLLIAFVFLILFWNVYSGILKRNFGAEFKSVCSVVAGLFVALTIYCFATKTSENYSRAVLITFLSVAIPIVYFERIVWKEHIRRKARMSKGEVLLFMSEKDIDSKIHYFTRQSEEGVIVTGIVTYEKSDIKEADGIPIVGCKDDLYKYVDDHDVECVYIYLNGVKLYEYIDFLVRRNIIVYRALRNLEKSSYQYKVEEMNGYKVLCIREHEMALGFAISKRIMDIVVALFALIVSLPITIITTIAIKIEDGGPVFYKSKRIGQYGDEFLIYKFRSMKLNADKLENMLTPEQLEQYHKEFKLDNDPRITKVGSFIRKHSIDELPQFLNILKGDMAFIGPRPLLRDEVEMYYPQNKDILLSLKPGLTGYWQAYARNNVTYESGERQRMELYYIEHSDWTMDIKILFRTVKIVLSGDGAQ